MSDDKPLPDVFSRDMFNFPTFGAKVGVLAVVKDGEHFRLVQSTNEKYLPARALWKQPGRMGALHTSATRIVEGNAEILHRTDNPRDVLFTEMPKLPHVRPQLASPRESLYNPEPEPAPVRKKAPRRKQKQSVT